MEQEYREFLEQVLRQAKKLGAEYADCRLYPETQSEEIQVENGNITALNSTTSAGFGVRVLHHGSWGFFATPILERTKIEYAVKKAIDSASQNAALQKEKVVLAPHKESWLKDRIITHQTKVQINPFSVSLEQKLILLASADEAMKQASPNVFWRIAHMSIVKTQKLFASTDGVLADQTFIESGASVRVHAADKKDGETQSRSYPDSHTYFMQGGYEIIKNLDLVHNAAAIAKEAEQLLASPPCPSGKRGIILMPPMLNLHGHETTHGFEADRVLGTEWTLTGGSFLTPLLPQIGEFRFGSEHVNLVADSITEHGVGTFAVDDEGTPAQRIPLVQNGIWKSLLTSRQTVPQLNQAIGKKYFTQSSGAVRADGYGNWPVIRMVNIVLEPGEEDFEALKDRVPNGTILFGTNKSWSIDDVRRHFTFGTEVAWEKVQGTWEMRKNAKYYGDNLHFWRNCNAVCNTDSFSLGATGNCGKADPLQTMHTGHGSSPAYFTNIQVGSVG